VDRPRHRHHAAQPQDRGRPHRRRHRRRRREPGRRLHGSNAGRRAPPAGGAAQLQVRRGRHRANGAARGRH